MPVEYLDLPFDEAIKFFRDKVNIPTARWTDLWQDMHAKGFMIAGAMKADLLSDFRGAVDRAISEGTSLEAFQKDFDTIVEKHGWSYNGGRGWRSRVIYETNVHTAYAAGRWQQMTDPDVMSRRPYLQYRHGDSAAPRPEHLAWDGLVLPADDPWWDTHYPPNGWGCKCSVFSLSERDMARLGKDAPDTAPDGGTYEWTDKATGQIRKVPDGIDPGWAYNAGKAADESYKLLADKFDTLPTDIARQWMKSYVREPAFEGFVDGRITGEFPVAVMDTQMQAQIGAERQTVWLSSETLAKNKAAHDELALADYRSLPERIDTAQLVVQDGGQTLVFIRANGNIYHAAVKTTRTGTANYLTSYRLSGEADVARMRKKGTVVRNEW